MIDQRPSSETRTGSTLETRMDAVKLSERQTALRALLSHPVLSSRNGLSELFVLVRRHADWLRQWLTDNCGWGLQLDGEFARLQKTPADVRDGTRAAVEPKSGLPFNRRKYVLLCLALASLERGDRQTTLGNLAQEVLSLVSADIALTQAGISFDLSNREQRSDLVGVVRLLLELRVLERLDGDEQLFLQNTSDVLYNVNRSVLALLLNLRRGPSTIAPELSYSDRMRLLVEEPRPDTDDARNRELRHKLTRCLLDDPILYFEDLDATEFEYLNRQRGRLLRRVEEATGLIAEVRAEGIAMLDERGDVTDVDIPKDGTEGHFTLLIAEFLAQRIRSQPATRIGIGELHEHASTLICEHSGHWRKSVQDPGAEDSLVASALERLEGLRLIACHGDIVIPRAAIARYGIGAVQDEKSELKNKGTQSTQRSLWEQET